MRRCGVGPSARDTRWSAVRSRGPGSRLYATFFCRNCGQEYHPVVLLSKRAVPTACCRGTSTKRRSMIPTATERPGYLMPEPENDAEFTFTGEPEDYPEEWIETVAGGAPRLRSDRRRPWPRALDGGCGRHDRYHRPASMVPSRQISLLPGLQATSPPDRRGRSTSWRPLSGRAQLRDNAAGIQRRPLDECARRLIAAAQAEAARLHRQPPGRRAAGRAFQRLSLRRPAAWGNSRGGRERQDPAG